MFHEGYRGKHRWGMNKNVTMKNIADALGVSTVTVSKALSDKDGVGEQLRRSIKQKADEMGYCHSVSKAKSVSDSSKFNIGVIVASNYVDPDSYAFYLKVYHYIILALTKCNYSGIMEIISDDMRENMTMPVVAAERKVDGIIILGQFSTAYVQKIKGTGIPLVLLDFYDGEVEADSVVTDNVYGAYRLTEYCIDKGHKKIAFVGSIHATASILDRYLGYYRALLVHGIEPRVDYVLEDRDENCLFKSEIALPEDMPTAFVCNCDELAYLLIEQLRNKGLRVPEDVSVVGFDNYTFIGHLTYQKLTTVAVNVEVMAGEAVSLLIRQIEGGAPSNVRKVIDGTLLIRDSVKDIRK